MTRFIAVYIKLFVYVTCGCDGMTYSRWSLTLASAETLYTAMTEKRAKGHEGSTHENLD